jgi:hypothetical protein
LSGTTSRRRRPAMSSSRQRQGTGGSARVRLTHPTT